MKENIGLISSKKNLNDNYSKTTETVGPLEKLLGKGIFWIV